MERCHAPVREISAHPDLEMSGQNWRNFRAFLFLYCTKLQSNMSCCRNEKPHDCEKCGAKFGRKVSVDSFKNILICSI